MTNKTLILFLVIAFSASSATLIVDGQANIFAAGVGSTASVGGGALPASYTFSPSGGLVLTFSDVSGLVNCCSGAPNSPAEGGSGAGGNTNINSAGGISGIIKNDATHFLVGVFTTGGANAGAAPARLDFSGNADNFTTLSPLLFQTFLIGNGLTDGGITQQFLVPAGATTLFLGFADGAGFQGNPCCYTDNTGSMTATFTVSSSTAPIPEPGTLLTTALAMIAVAGIGHARRRG